MPDQCRPLLDEDGHVIASIRGPAMLTPEGQAAMRDLVDAVRARAAADDPDGTRAARQAQRLAETRAGAALRTRLPRQFDILEAAALEAGWNWQRRLSGPFEFGQVDRELVEASASCRCCAVPHRALAWYHADAPPDQPRPRFRCGASMVGQGNTLCDVSMRAATEYIRRHQEAR